MITVRNIDIAVTSSGFLLTLQENEGRPVLPIGVGMAEAQAISLALSGSKAERPLTQDLLHQVVRSLGAQVTATLIRRYDRGIYYAELQLDTPAGRLSLDCRPSDAIGLALRCRAPVFVSAEVMAKCGVCCGQPPSTAGLPEAFEPAAPSENSLESRLRKAVAAENFELAARLRDEISQERRR
ncbi:MAG: hypothetical protein RL095_129 [Verrucomicrobiota bacterium]